MSKKIGFIVHIILLFSLPSTGLSYDWPIKPFSGPHSIYGTLGEYRADHLHAGVDIGCAAGTEVFPIDSGKAFRVDSGYDAGIKVGSKDYIHLVEGTRINDDPDGDNVPEGATVVGKETRLGYTAITHLHFEENDGSANPLRSTGLNNFADSTAPTINDIDFFRQKSTKELAFSNLSGLVDIRANAKDSMDSGKGSDTVAIYKIGYEIINQNNKVVASASDIIFNTISDYELALIYDTNSSKSNYYYWVTNSPSENLAWNTAEHSDGNYEVKVIAEDIKDKKAEKKVEVTLDNYVNVESTIPEINSFNVSTNSQITITFDREMKTESIREAILVTSSAGHTHLPSEDTLWSNNNKMVTFSLSHGHSGRFY